MDWWALAAAFGYCAASAVVMVLPAEVYLFAAAVTTSTPPILLAAAAAVGQVGGKMLSYLAGRGVLSMARMRAKPSAKWAKRMQRVQAWCGEHTWGPSAVTLVSAFAGLPPYALIAVLAGTIRMRWWLFAGLSLGGRFLRFWAVVSVPDLLPPALFGL